MSDNLKVVGVGLLAVVGLLGMTWLMQGNHFFLYKMFAPAYEQVRRETFEQSKAYNQGMTQELDAAYLDYTKGTPEQKAAIKSVVLHRVADYPTKSLPEHLQAWVGKLRDEGSEIKEVR